MLRPFAQVADQASYIDDFKGEIALGLRGNAGLALTDDALAGVRAKSPPSHFT